MTYTTEELIEKSLQIATPAWPLQNSVAVNPFWFLRQQPFASVLAEAETAARTPLFMPPEYYEDRIQRGQITTAAIQEALLEARALWPELPQSLQDFMAWRPNSLPRLNAPKAFSESFSEKSHWPRLIEAEVGKYAAAYLDERQATAPFPWQDDTFWNGWIAAQKLDRTMVFAGVSDFPEHLRRVEPLFPHAAIEHMLRAMGLPNQDSELAYLRRLVASVMGWMTQFKYVEWQRQLGYPTRNQIHSVDLLAVRLAYDFVLFCKCQSTDSTQIAAWRSAYQSTPTKASALPDAFTRRSYVLQLADELSYQRNVSSQLAAPRETLRSKIPSVQMTFCIDVRSEILRRQIEQVDQSIHTIGFAGFFGLPFDYQKLDEKAAGHRLPVLLTPAYTAEEVEINNSTQGPRDSLRVDRAMINSYFRNLRKNPLASFVYVELFGILYFAKMMSRSWRLLTRKIQGFKTPERFDDQLTGPSNTICGAGGSALNEQQKIDRAATVLQHMGLTDTYAHLVLIVGHGSETTNNAFGSSLDCGACGGHAGDINARLLANLLNQPGVRAGLRKIGYSIPSDTWFAAAVHETVTDEVYILDRSKIPGTHLPTVQKLEATLRTAALAARTERLELRSNLVDPQAARRASNWSEVRPEWGLAGNACFIVAPRELSLGVKLDGRSFLHDYDWKKDAKFEFKTLELIMTAPMVVTNWINMQYYASTVAPRVYGSGSKILHNLTNETGVVEGNGGDLRVGLPLQSIHDGSRFIHEPLRLSAFIRAPRTAIEQIINQHSVVQELIDNGWIHLLCIDPETSTVSRRLPGGRYFQ
ncbi:MAG: DUF2309 domain-containing protein [Bdellovibrionales bacterium]|nr:DUF2309 domain-containing protein [Bdellovibrionales bacterium]